jgi:hypothetical protein
MVKTFGSAEYFYTSKRGERNMKKFAVWTAFVALFTIAVAGTALVHESTPVAAMEGPGPYIIAR